MIVMMVRHEGTTSACAENTNPPNSFPIRITNYLRVRGEYANPCEALGIHLELPPRARRIHLHETRRDLIDGTTSACAENT